MSAKIRFSVHLNRGKGMWRSALRRGNYVKFTASYFPLKGALINTTGVESVITSNITY